MVATKSSVFRFVDIIVREREFAIAKAGHVQQVEPKAFRVLLILIRNPNKLITKEELLNAVWSDAAVTENSLARAIALLRRLLGDNSRDPQFIQTVTSVGYRFLPAVDVSMEPAGYLDAIRDANALNPNGNVKAAPNCESSVTATSGPANCRFEILRRGMTVLVPDFELAMDGMKAVANWIASPVSWTHMQSEEKRQQAHVALKSVMVAVEATRQYLASLRTNHANQSPELQRHIASLWTDAANEMLPLNSDLAIQSRLLAWPKELERAAEE